jgi:hypothetical protein
MSFAADSAAGCFALYPLSEAADLSIGSYCPDWR